LLETQQGGAAGAGIVDVVHLAVRGQARRALGAVLGITGLDLVVLHPVDGEGADGLQCQVGPLGPEREFQPPLVLFDAEPDRFSLTAFQQVLPPDERPFAVGHRAAHHVVDAAIADDRAGTELLRSEHGHLAGRQRILAGAGGPWFLGPGEGEHHDDNGRDHQQDADDDQECAHGALQRDVGSR